MKVGVYFDLRNPQQWRQKPSRLYGFTLEACQEAERLGASSAWFSEHHLFDDDYLCAPLTFAAAVAARTDRPPPKPVDLQRVVNAEGGGPLGSFTYGTPERVAEVIRAGTAGAPVDTVFLWASIGRMEDAVVMRNLETICARLAPLVA